MNNAKVSVIIPVYNKEQTLCKCVTQNKKLEIERHRSLEYFKRILEE